MELVKTTKENKIYKKRSGRYGVKTLRGVWVNGEAKAKILAAEGLVKATFKKAEPAEEAPAESAAE